MGSGDSQGSLRECGPGTCEKWGSQGLPVRPHTPQSPFNYMCLLLTVAMVCSIQEDLAGLCRDLLLPGVKDVKPFGGDQVNTGWEQPVCRKWWATSYYISRTFKILCLNQSHVHCLPLPTLTSFLCLTLPYPNIVRSRCVRWLAGRGGIHF